METDLRRWMRLVEGEPEALSKTDWRQDGWYIDRDGDLLQCDHDGGLHHAQIALDAFPPDEIDPDDPDYDPDDDGGDAAIAAAQMSGWIRSVYVPGKILSIGWSEYESPSQAARRTLLTWMSTHAGQFPKIEIHTDREFKTFDAMAEAMVFVKRAFR